MPPFGAPHLLGFEIAYTAAILLICLGIYIKTKEIFSLTGYKGIQYFRLSFLFLGLSYALRLLLPMVSTTFHMREFFGFLFLIPMGYLSTMALLLLFYCAVWKMFRFRHYIALSNLLAILLSIGAFLTRSHFLLLFIQLFLLLLGLGLLLFHPHHIRVFSKARVLYLLTFAFWLFNLFVVSPQRGLPFEAKWALQGVSLIVFGALYYKVSRLAK